MIKYYPLISMLFILLMIITAANSETNTFRISISSDLPQDLESLKSIWSTFNGYSSFENLNNTRILRENSSPIHQSQLLSRLRKYKRTQPNESNSSPQNFQSEDKDRNSFIENQKLTHPQSNVTQFSLYTTFGNAYIVEAIVGSENQLFTMMLDTGSSYNWVSSSNCSSCKELNIQKTFKSDTSTTFKTKNEEISLQYGKGKVNGILFTDQFGLNRKLHAENQDLVLVNEIEDLSFFPSSGLLGLGFSELSDDRNTILDNLKLQQKIDKKIFAFALNGVSDNIEYGTTGKDFFILGGDGIDKELADVTDSFKCKVTLNQYWAVDVTQILPIISDVEMDIHLKTDIAIVDTGTSFIVFDHREYEEIKKFFIKLKKLDCGIDETYNLIKCSSTNHSVYPTFKIVLCQNSRPILINPDLYLVCDTNVCYVRIAGINFGLIFKRIVILGDIFIRSQYILFDQEEKSIQFFNKISHPEEPNNEE